jgi:hypothetical protein
MAKMKLPLDLRGQDMKGCQPCSPNEFDNRGILVTFVWDEPYDFPDEGTMVVKFKVRKREEEITDTKKSYEVRVEFTDLTSVTSNEPEMPARGEPETGTILDEMRDAMLKD